MNILFISLFVTGIFVFIYFWLEKLSSSKGFLRSLAIICILTIFTLLLPSANNNSTNSGDCTSLCAEHTGWVFYSNNTVNSVPQCVCKDVHGTILKLGEIK